ncbi:UPF0176 protein YceA [Serratia symbiotica]|nr:UPF0176 protein YceA [Serratia symbiotica]
MLTLHNKISIKELKKNMLTENTPRITISFYKYFNINNPKEFRDKLYIQLNNLDIFGRIYIAKEGINAQISIPKFNFTYFKNMLFTSYPELNQIRLNIGLEDNGKSFWVLCIKVRHRIISDGINDKDFNPKNVGKYIKAKQVNQMSECPNTLFVDVRNHYEYEIGHFKNAIEIPSKTFREQLPMILKILKNKKNENIVIYCTGGIRCEKASAYMKYNNFKNVYQIEGGIIEYVHQAKKQGLPLKFIGKNFVFDKRMGERITNDIIAHCYQCGILYDTHTNCKNPNCHLLFIQCEQCKIKFQGCCNKICQKKLYHR